MPFAVPWQLTILSACILIAAAAVPVVRIGGLFPRFKTAAAGYARDESGNRRFSAFVQAIREINNKSDRIADDLLPQTSLLFTARDSKRDDASAFLGARALTTSAFGGLGVSCVVGAASSGPSKLAALALGPTRTPQISYSSTSAALSDGEAFRYFLRTPPSDAFQASGLADLTKNLFGFSRVAAVSSSDAYGAAGIEAFTQAAATAGLTILASLKFANDAADFSSQYESLLACDAHVIVLFCQTSDATRFIDGAYDAGIGGEGYLWLGSDAVTNPSTMSAVTDEARRERVFRGLIGLSPAVGQGSAS